MFIVDVPLGVKKFKTIVEARAYAVKQINDSPQYIIDIYETKKGQKGAKKVGEVDYNPGMGWYYFSIPDHRSRPIYKNGKLAGRF